MTVTALRALSAAVQRNESPSPALFQEAYGSLSDRGTRAGLPHLARLAAADSFDAAKELHRAVLPDRSFTIHPCVVYTHTDDTENASTGQAFDSNGRATEETGRAWFVAITEGLADDLEAALEAGVSEAPREKQKARVLEDEAGELRIDALVESVMDQDALVSAVQYIMLHHTRQRRDGSSYVFYGSATYDICALFEKVHAAQREQAASVIWTDYTKQRPSVGTRFVWIDGDDHCSSGMAMMTDEGPLDAEDMMNLDEMGTDWWRGTRWAPLPAGYHLAIEDYTGD
jgi:hypothetical protein